MLVCCKEKATYTRYSVTKLHYQNNCCYLVYCLYIETLKKVVKCIKKGLNIVLWHFKYNEY